MAFHHPSNCEKNKDLILQMAHQGRTLTQIAKSASTNRRHVKAFLKKHGIELSFPCGSRHANWKGGRVLDKNGYVLVLAPLHPYARRGNGNYILEHRLVMESYLGRFLKPEEVVHHKNKDKLDNRICNLALFSRNSEHLKLELTGRIPKWTDDGLRRMREGIVRSAKMRRPETQIQSERDVRGLR